MKSKRYILQIIGFNAMILICGYHFISKPVFSQASAYAGVSATIITPITINKLEDMSFGNIAADVTRAGTVTINPAGIRSSTGGVILPAAGGNITAAAFKITGYSNCTYNITLPAGDFIISDGSGNTMVFNSFISNPSAEGSLSNGEEIVKIGATLHINANQVPGNYTNPSGFQVVVNYN